MLLTRLQPEKQIMKFQITKSNEPVRTLRSVCVDAYSLGVVNTTWGKKRQVKIVFETEELKENGYPRTATRTFNISYYEKAALRKELESWLGRPLTASEMLNGFPFERLVGKAAELDVEDARTEDGAVFLRITVIRPSRANPLAPTGSYRRWEDSLSPAKAAPADNQDAELEAQFERHAAHSDNLEATESAHCPDNANTVVVSAGN
jgi:hypothetical protein